MNSASYTGRTAAPSLPLDSAQLIEHLPSLRRLARKLVADEDAAEDVLGEALAKTRLAKQEVRDLRSYAAGVVRFVASRRNRAEARRRHHEGVGGNLRQGAAPAADTIAERVELMGATLEAMGQLPAAQSRAIGLRYVDDMPVAEIAEREGCTPSTVRTHLSRGLATLRERLDARFGGRATWSSVLSPWALDPAYLAGPSDLGSKATAPTQVSAATTTAAVGGALLTMTTLKLALVAIPLALAATWFATNRVDTDSIGAVESSVAAAPQSASGSASSQLPGAGADPGGAMEAAAGDLTGDRRSAFAPLGSKTDLAQETFPVRGRIVAMGTGDPQPGIRVELSSGDPKIKIPLEAAVTDAEGWFEVDDQLLPACELLATLLDDESRSFIGIVQGIDFPFTKDLELDGGTAMYFEYVGDAVAPGTQCTVLPRRGALHRSTTRSGQRPWTRFDEPLPGAVKELRLESHDGFRVGAASLASGKGTLDSPVVVKFEAGGRVEFTTGADVLQLSNPMSLWRVGADAAAPLHLSFRQRSGLDGYVAAASHLLPGSYRWEFRHGDVTRGGTIEVQPLETASVDLGSLEWSGERTAVLIDTSAMPGAKVDQWTFHVIDESDMQGSLRAKIERTGAPEAGLWTAFVDNLPTGSWKFSIGDVGNVMLSQQVIQLEVGSTVGPIVVTPAPLEIEVMVRVVDAQSGALVPDVKLWAQTGFAGRPAETSRTGEFGAMALSGAESSSLFALAEGYSLTQVDVRPGDASTDITIKLAKGTRTRVLVFDSGKMSFAKGMTVHMGGQRLGITADDGAFWFERESTAGPIEVAKDQADYEVVMDPFKAGRGESMDTPGYIFVVRSR